MLMAPGVQSSIQFIVVFNGYSENSVFEDDDALRNLCALNNHHATLTIYISPTHQKNRVAGGLSIRFGPRCRVL